MRTVQKTYTLFNIAELEGEAVEKAYTDWLAKGQNTRMQLSTATRSKPSATSSVSPARTIVTTVRPTVTVSTPNTRKARKNFRASACGHSSIIISITGCTRRWSSCRGR